jgi:hypothetical protein
VRFNQRRFVAMVADHTNKRLMEVVEGKEDTVLRAALAHIPGTSRRLALADENDLAVASP